MLFTEKQLDELPFDTCEDLLHLLYTIEDQLGYKCKRVSKTINYLQDYLHPIEKKGGNFMKRVICEDKDGNTLFSFDFEEDIQIQHYDNCEIADIETDGDITVIRIQEIDKNNLFNY